MTNKSIITKLYNGTKAQAEGTAEDLLDIANSCPDVQEFIESLKETGTTYTEAQLRAYWAREYFDQVTAQLDSLRTWFETEAEEPWEILAREALQT